MVPSNQRKPAHPAHPGPTRPRGPLSWSSPTERAHPCHTALPGSWTSWRLTSGGQVVATGVLPRACLPCSWRVVRTPVLAWLLPAPRIVSSFCEPVGSVISVYRGASGGSESDLAPARSLVNGTAGVAARRQVRVSPVWSREPPLTSVPAPLQKSPTRVPGTWLP